MKPCRSEILAPSNVKPSYLRSLNKSRSCWHRPKVGETACPETVTLSMPLLWDDIGCKVSRNRKSWKQRVFRDLQPYICSFEHCSSGSQLFLTRNDWIYHELQVHRRRFICHHCKTNCPDRPSMYEHLRQHYRDDLGSDRLSIVLDLCNYQAEETDEVHA
ncbi:hypothetical protein V8F20_003321 [Naviculisporaceae sp. PSN 640]